MREREKERKKEKKRKEKEREIILVFFSSPKNNNFYSLFFRERTNRMGFFFTKAHAIIGFKNVFLNKHFYLERKKERERERERERKKEGKREKERERERERKKERKLLTDLNSCCLMHGVRINTFSSVRLRHQFE